jgi:hypothetical protein
LHVRYNVASLTLVGGDDTNLRWSDPCLQ